MLREIIIVFKNKLRPIITSVISTTLVILFFKKLLITHEFPQSTFHEIRMCMRGDGESTYSENDAKITFDDNFDNNTGAGRFIVPNIIHFIRYNKFELNFIDYVVLKAAMHNHRPDNFFFHTNIRDVQYTGKYWDLVRKDKDLWSRIKVFFLDIPKTIFGQKLSEYWRVYHGGDIGRIRVLKKYGGIYLDNDAYVVRCLDKYRKFEAVVNCDENEAMGSQVIIAHKNARFLTAWLNSYRDYRADLWYYNAGELPSEIIEVYPEVVHRLKGNFAVLWNVSQQLYIDPNFDWRKLDAIHLLVNHRRYMDPHFNDTPVFDENTIKTYKYQFRDMAREVLDSL